MAFIALKWFAGMVPRYGSQHLKGPHATEAENCNLYSGELRPLTKPALAHKFCQPDDSCFRAPIPEDPSVPPEPPPEPPKCVVVSIVTQPTNPDDWSLVEAGTILTLSVVVNADATSPIQYQWLKNSQAIPGAVDSVLTYAVQDADDYASFTVFVQNPCGQEISLPFTIGLVTPAKPCIYYECDAYFTKVLELSPNIYWPMNITADLNAYPTSQLIKDYSGNGNDIPWAGQQPTSLSTATNTLLNYDACDPRLTALLSGAGANLDVRSPPYIQGIPPTNTWTWLAHFQDVSTGTTSANIQLFNYRASDIPVGINDKQWAILLRDGYSVPTDAFIQVQFVGDFCQFPKLETLDPAWRDKFLGIQMWWDGAITQVRLLIDFVVVASATITDEFLKNATPAETYLLSNGQGYESQEHAVWNRVLTDQELLDLKTAYQQNDATYVDPNPDCLPATCNQYECDAYDKAVLGGAGLASYTMLNEDFAVAQQILIDQSTSTSRNSSGANVNEGPFLLADLCTNNNSVFIGGDTKYRILQNGSDQQIPADTADPEWAVGFDDITAHGFFRLQNSNADAGGALISFYGLGYPYDIDCRLVLDSDGLGHRVQLAWIGLAGGNQPRYWTSEKLPITATIDGLTADDPFWWGVNVKRTGSNTNATVSAEFYFCDLKPGSTFRRIAVKPPGTVVGALFRSIETTDTASCRVQALEWGTINGSSFSGNVARLGVEFGALTDERLATLTEAYTRNKATYVDPRTGCIPP